MASRGKTNPKTRDRTWPAPDESKKVWTRRATKADRVPWILGRKPALNGSFPMRFGTCTG